MSNYFLSTSNRIKSTPFTSRNNLAGVKKYSVYNNTLIPTVFKSLEDDYNHLIKNVQLWDVCCQKIIEVKGNNSLSLMRYLFCRDFSHISPSKAYYAPIVNFEGRLLNDPVVFCMADDHFLISLSDSDLFNWISAINHTKEFYSEVNETDILTIAVQGPKSEKLISKIFGEEIKFLKFFNFKKFSFNKESLIVSKTGFSKQSGYEILLTNSNNGILLWDLIIEKGEEFNIRVGCPNMIERVENDLLSYGSEMTNKDTPFDCGLGKYCKLDIDYDFIGKSALLKQKKGGFEKDIFKIHFNFESEEKPVFYNNLSVFKKDIEIGRATSIVWSPKNSKYVGFLIASKKIMNNLYIIFLENFCLSNLL
jgi:dimethylsulfoniopropionate demethylase